MLLNEGKAIIHNVFLYGKNTGTGVWEQGAQEHSWTYGTDGNNGLMETAKHGASWFALLSKQINIKPTKS
jgi:hypothetical protein